MVGNEFCRSFVQYFVGVELRNFRSDDIGQIVSGKSRFQASEQSVPGRDEDGKIKEIGLEYCFPAWLFPLKIP